MKQHLQRFRTTETLQSLKGKCGIYLITLRGTNRHYIGQSVICTLIFYNTGFGLGGTVGPTIYLLVGVPVYAFQVIASGWWLARFRFGPLEWLWRMATYGQRIPLARRAAPTAEAI